ncbi:MAG: ParM/StbA family protein [Gammaproteobacteria bacterium]|nr:ParM/StbA family protein [Gammaproteobacteria bacterium]NNF61000.1 ParM/StbA family protein [Gammaproteobacteria bacterium]NNM21086.1 ParM/StbA family protein [Gammaproteobacteria bacterium]
MEVIGLDIGFGYTKATNGQRFIVFKSVYGEASELQFREQLLSDPDEEEYLHIELDDHNYFVGELAERQSVERYFTLDQSQFVAEFTKVLALTPLSQMVERQEPIKLVAGLPISHYRRHRSELINILKGQHPVVVTDKNGDREDTVVRISEVRVVPQPFGTVMNLMLSDLGEVRDRRFLSEKIGVIDVGFRTTDYTIADRTRYSERGSKTTDTGISRAYATVAAKLQESSGISVELYRLYDAVDRGSIKIHGKRYDLKLVKEHAFSQLASAIATDANRLWANDWDIDRVMITGGGGAVLAPFLAKHLKGEIIPVEPGTDTRLNNVRGYWKYGKRLWARAATATATK